MTRINLGRVFLGGLVAGIVGFGVDFALNMLVFGGDLQIAMRRLNIDPDALQGPENIAKWVGADILFGILLVWTYAAMRPRFGAGPKTAVVSAVAIYTAVTIVVYSFMSMGIFTPGYFLKASAAALVSVIASSLAGSALYKE